MRPLWIPLSCCLALVSCDKVKEAVNQAKAKVSGDQTPAKTAGTSGPGEPGGEVDKELAALVDRTDEGTIFRKDLPFPTKLTSRTVTQMTGKGVRMTRRSALGAETGIADGITETIEVWKRDGDRMSVTIEKQGTVPTPPAAATADPGAPAPAATAAASHAPAKGKPGPPPPPPPLSPAPAAPGTPAPGGSPATTGEAGPDLTGLSAVFRNLGGKWKAENPRSGEFRKVAWLQDIEPFAGGLAMHGSALPQSHWFAKRRLKEGAALTLSGENMEVIFPGATTGKIDLVYEAAEAIDGHPCGRFSIRGAYTMRGHMGLDGHRTDLEVTISEGKIWLSQLHPLVLRQDLETILSASSNGGGLAVHTQGEVTIKSRCEWKPVK